MLKMAARQAFVLRIAPSKDDRLAEALAANQIIIGWAEAEGLLDLSLSRESFRKIVADAYHSHEPNLRKAGASAGHLWRFIREMNKGDLVVVPHGPEFYVAEVNGPASCDDTKVANDTAYRRAVVWQNQKRPIPRDQARSALISRMKIQGTSAPASDLIEEISECVQLASSGQKRTFKTDLQARLIQATLDELRKGRMESYGFERLVEDVLVAMGAVDTHIVPRLKDKGADIVATFIVAGAIQQIVAVQVKHWQPQQGPVGSDVVEQLIKGIEAGSADLGMVVTSGVIGDDANKTAKDYYEQQGIQIVLVDGEDLAKLIVELGIRAH